MRSMRISFLNYLRSFIVIEVNISQYESVTKFVMIMQSYRQK
jgi:hypothetical protein